MTRIALDWMIEGTSIEAHIIDQVSEGQYTREFLLGHFVQVMCATVACGFRETRPARHSRSVNLSWWLRCPLSTASLVGWKPGVSAAIVRETCRSSPRNHFRCRSPPARTRSGLCYANP